ncbi:acyl-CoA carboxylase subunit beta [Mariniblastus fucicola]|uniref:Methylmalonyl-CoA carboxyltransferase 12S subunit n=1 Tax=Mariniblastus fucicola TaxID=980251 RepID=A0A5B9PJ86_9BACT|nr:acyl-CoA carboxylase subunit beta [Mariniblastus fucicola]QEG22613.1 Methylmalonyl-CoA carboxyltransferase 12S subunit [Mariniblastus fucicola]
MSWSERIAELETQSQQIELGGGQKSIDRQHAKGRMTARERIAALLDDPDGFLEIGRWAAWEMYQEWGGSISASVVCGIGKIENRSVMIIANDATIKAGAFFPMTCKKVLRAQRIAMRCHLPLLYLVDSAGVFLPLQDEIFPDEDDFGRIFRNNAVISAMGIPQIAAIMGNCVAGGGYLPVLCDKLVMTEGSGLYLAGPALVKSAIGQEVTSEDLGGAAMHSEISGTIDFREPDDDAAIARVKQLMKALPVDTEAKEYARDSADATSPEKPTANICDDVPFDPQERFDVRDMIRFIIDADSLVEFKADYGQTVVCAYARIGGYRVGIIANQRNVVKSAKEGLQMGGVIYHDSADKEARFIMDCNQTWTPIIFLQDVMGFMVGRDSEQAGIIRAGAKVVNAISNSRVPKITVITGGSYGAGNYAMCGKAFDPRFIFAWPNARYAVMGGKTAAKTILDITIAAMRRAGNEPDAEEMEALREKVESSYDETTDIRHAASRLWVDGIINPEDTRDVLISALEAVTQHADDEPFRTGVLQV